MAELQTLIIRRMPAAVDPPPVIRTELASPGTRGPAPVWRSLLSPSPGQRALVLGNPAQSLLFLLKDFGVQVDRSLPSAVSAGDRGFDFILEERTGWGSSLERKSVASLLAPNGRWIIALHGSRVVGFRRRWVLSGVRRWGFRRVETFYAHEALWAPQVLVPLERPQPFEFFLRLTVGGGRLRRRTILSAFQALEFLGLHRGFLPNCIMVARKS